MMQNHRSKSVIPAKAGIHGSSTLSEKNIKFLPKSAPRIGASVKARAALPQCCSAAFGDDNSSASLARRGGMALFLAMTVSAPSAYACPLCKEALSKMGEIWAAIGFNVSIYFMIATPFILVGTFGAILYFNYRKHNRK